MKLFCVENRRVKAEGLSPALTDLPPVFVLCAGMWTDKIQKGGGWNTAPLPRHLQRPT